MKNHHHAATWKLLLLLIIGSASPNAAVSAPALRRSQPNHIAGISRSPGRSLLSHPPPQQQNTHFVAVPEGKLRLVDSNSGAVIYSVDLGAPLYSSYKAPGVRDDNRLFYADVDEDGHLYRITDGEKQNLRMTVADFVQMTPYTLDDRSVTVGSKKTITYEINPFTGKKIRKYTSSHGEKQGVTFAGIIKAIKQLVKSAPTSPKAAKPRIDVLVTEYTLTAYFPNSNEVAWSLTYLEIGVLLFCSDIANPVTGGLGSVAGSDIVLPLPCQSKIRVGHQNRISIEPSRHDRILMEQMTDKIPSDRASNKMHGMLVMHY